MTENVAMTEEMSPKEETTGKPDLLCGDCGEALSAFLQEMAEHNAQLTACPKCGKHHDLKPRKAKAVPRPRAIKPRSIASSKKDQLA